MVAEPKAHQVGRKRQNVNKTGNDWDYFYDSYCSSTMNRSSTMRPKKRKRLVSSSSRMVTLSDAVNSSNINVAVAAATMAQQQQQLVQQHQHQHQQHQQQQQAAAVAMAAMANLLPQQQMLLHQHQQSILSNTNGTAGIAAAACNGSTTAPHHASLNMYLQQQQQHQQMKQQHAAAAAVAAAQYAAVTNGGLQLKMSSPLMTAPTGPQAASSASLHSHDTDQMLATTTAPNAHQAQLLQPQLQQQQATAHIMQPLTLTLSPQHSHQQQQQQQQQHQQHHHLHHQQQQMQQQQQQQQHHHNNHHLQPKHLQLQQSHQQAMQQHQMQHEQLASNQQWGPFKVYSNPDTLICGNCRECFNELAELLDHKRSYCKLRFTCKCQDITMPTKNPSNGAKLLCAVCKDAFVNPWDLMVHAQAAHMVNIYELGTEPNNNTSNSNNNNNNTNNNSSNTNTNAIPTTNTNSPLAGDVVDASSTAVTNEPNNNSLHCNSNDNDTNNNTKNHNGMTVMSRGTFCFSAPVKTQSPPVSSVLVATNNNANGMDMALMSGATNGNSSNGIASTAELGHTSDSEAHLELKFGICNSPIGTINNKEEPHRDETSQDGRLSDDIKMVHHTNGSVSSRGSSPALNNDDVSHNQQRACIVRTLSLEATTATTPTTSATLGLIPSSLALSLNNNAATQAAAAVAPQ